jgi:hypothetical protein
MSISTDKISYIAFVFLGLVCLLSWNVILASLDFYEKYLGEYTPTFVFPMMNFVLNVFLQIYLVIFGNKFTYFKQMLAALLVCILTMTLLPIVVLNVESSKTAFIFCCLLIALQGFANALFQSNVFGICGFLPFKFIIAVSYGTGLSGIVVNLLRYILIASYGVENQGDDSVMIASIYIFYGITVLFLFVGVALLFLVFKNPWFIHNVTKGGNKDEYSVETLKYIRSNNTFEDEEDLNAKLEESAADIDNEKLEAKEERTTFQIFKVLAKKLYNLNILMLINYITTFMIFPGLSFEIPS